MCADEFTSFLENARKSPIDEKINAFGDIVEKMMIMFLRIPDLVDQALLRINQQIASMESRINTINTEVSNIKTKATLSTPIVATPTAPSSAPPPSGGPPGRPPGGPPGGPPPLPGGPGVARPANPQSLRGAIMGELKQLFAKRNQG